MKEKNTLIANFMGLEVSNSSVYPDSEAYVFTNTWEESKYHKSWDWLMPVVEKISKIKYKDSEDTAYPRTFGMSNQETGQFMVRFNRYFLHQADTLIEATYEAVVEFIEGHNN